jgi:ribosomal protein S18 acetylase RimI-like enzyme
MAEPPSVAPLRLGPPRLPPGLQARRPTRDDLPDIVDLVHRCERATVGGIDTTADELVDAFTQAAAPADTSAWLVLRTTGQQPVAWLVAWDDGVGSTVHVDCYVDERATRLPELLYDALIATAVAATPTLATERGRQALTLGMGVFQQDEGLRAALRRAGLQPRRLFARLRRDLEPGLVAPPEPPGLRIRGLRLDDDRDWRAFHATDEAAFVDHWGHHVRTYEEWRTRLDAWAAPDVEGWLLAEQVDGPDAGTVVGVCETSGTLLSEGGGWVSSLGVLPSHRGRGVAGALLETCCARMSARGLQWVGLAVDTENATGALGLYERSGFRPWRVVEAWQIDLPAR